MNVAAEESQSPFKSNNKQKILTACKQKQTGRSKQDYSVNIQIDHIAAA